MTYGCLQFLLLTDDGDFNSLLRLLESDLRTYINTDVESFKDLRMWTVLKNVRMWTVLGSYGCGRFYGLTDVADLVASVSPAWRAAIVRVPFRTSTPVPPSVAAPADNGDKYSNNNNNVHNNNDFI